MISSSSISMACTRSGDSADDRLWVLDVNGNLSAYVSISLVETTVNVLSRKKQIELMTAVKDGEDGEMKR
jgi:hypothetical protein